MPGATQDEFPRVDATPAELRAALLKIAAELRMLRIGNQPDRIERIVEMLAAPRLGGVLSQIAHPKSWLTREGGMWLAEQVMLAASIIADLIPDAEITGSDRAVARAKAWLEDLDLIPDP
jgi:hypothetical protein